MLNNESFFTKNFIFLVSGIFFIAVGLMQLIPVFPLFALEVIKLHEGHIGLVVSAYSVSALLGRPIVGYALDNYHKTTVLSIATIVFTVATFSFTLTINPVYLVAIRLVQGFTWAAISTSNMTIAMDLIPSSRRAEGIGLYSLALPTAMVVGPELGVNILNHFGFNGVFILSSVLCFVAFLLSLRIKNPGEVIVRRPISFSPKVLFETKALVTAFLQFFYSFMYSGIATYIPIYVAKKNLDRTSFFYLSFAFSVILSRVICRNLFQKKGPTFIIIFSFLSCSLGAISIAMANDFRFLTIGGLLYGIGGGLLIPAINTMTMNVVAPYNRGRASATTYTALDLGTGIGAFTVGNLVKTTSYEEGYLFCSAIALVPLLFYILYGRKIYEKYLKMQEAI